MLIRHTLLYLPAQLIGPVAQFVSIVVFTHWMDPNPYGVLTYVMASQDLVFFLCLSWWSQYTIRYLGDRSAEAETSYRGSEFTIMLSTIVAQIAASILVILLISTTLSAPLVLSTILFLVTRCFNLHLGERARAQGRIFDYTMACSVGPLAGLCLAFAAVSLVSPTPIAALLGYGAAQSISLVWLAARQDIEMVLRRPDPGLLRRSLSFGLPLIAAGLAAWLSMNSIRIFVDHEIGPATMGLIAVGWSLGHRLTSTASALVTVAAFPLAVESFRSGSRARAFQQISSNGLLMFGILLPATVGLYLVQGPLIALFVAEPFRATTIAVLPVALAAGVFRNIRTHVADQVFILIEQTRMVCLMTIVEAVLVVIGCGIGLNLGGAVGAAVGSTAGYGVAMILSFVFAHWRTGLHVPYARVGLIIVAVTLMAAAIRTFSGLGPTDDAVAHVLLVIVLGAATYGIAILVLFPPVARGLWQQSRRLMARNLV